MFKVIKKDPKTILPLNINNILIGACNSEPSKGTDLPRSLFLGKWNPKSGGSHKHPLAYRQTPAPCTEELESAHRHPFSCIHRDMKFYWNWRMGFHSFNLSHWTSFKKIVIFKSGSLTLIYQEILPYRFFFSSFQLWPCTELNCASLTPSHAHLTPQPNSNSWCLWIGP